VRVAVSGWRGWSLLSLFSRPRLATLAKARPYKTERCDGLAGAGGVDGDPLAAPDVQMEFDVRQISRQSGGSRNSSHQDSFMSLRFSMSPVSSLVPYCYTGTGQALCERERLDSFLSAESISIARPALEMELDSSPLESGLFYQRISGTGHRVTFQGRARRANTRV
jgi:hypothetical protein